MYKNLRPVSLGIDATLLEGLELAKATGYGGLEVDLLEVEQLVQKNSVKYVKDLFRQADIRVAGWKLPVEWRSDDSEYYDELAKLPGRAKLAAELESHRSWTVVRGWHDSIPFKENWDFHSGVPCPCRLPVPYPLSNSAKDRSWRLGGLRPGFLSCTRHKAVNKADR